MRPSGRVTADGLPSVIMMIWRMSLRCAVEQAARQPQALARVRVVRPDLHAAELADRHFLRRIVEEHGVQRVARVLMADQIRQRHRHALGRREAIFAVEHHAVAAVEQQHRRARALVIALRDHQIFVVDVNDSGVWTAELGQARLTPSRADSVMGQARLTQAGPAHTSLPRSAPSPTRRGSSCRRIRTGAAGRRPRCRWPARACRAGRRCCGRSIRAGRAARDSRGNRAPCR